MGARTTAHITVWDSMDLQQLLMATARGQRLYRICIHLVRPRIELLKLSSEQNKNSTHWVLFLFWRAWQDSNLRPTGS